jgi:hypothetical protein
MNAPLSFAEERDNRKQAATRKRVVILLVACGVVIVARFFIKDPPPPKPPDHANKPFKAMPGMLKNIPLTEQAKMNPEMLAKLREADLNALNKKPVGTALAQAYKPMEPALENLKDKEMAEEFRYQYAKRRKISEQKHQEAEALDLTKVMLVRLANGRYLKAERANTTTASVSIQMNRAIVANLPKKMVTSVSEDALSWVEPVPKGQVRLKPAKGITITVNENTSKRITVFKTTVDES